MKAPNTGVRDCDHMIVETFVRQPYDDMHGDSCPKLLIKSHPYDTVLSYEQALELIRYLRQQFCPHCRGTGVDEDAIGGRCDVCFPDLPF